MSREILVLRAKPHNIPREDEFLSGVLSVGWPCLGDLTGKTKEEIQNAFHENWPESGPLGLTQLWNFISLPKGSLVLVPSLDGKTVHFFETTSSYLYNASQDENSRQKGNPHQLHARLLKTVYREIFPKHIKNSLLAARRAVTVFTKYANEVEAVLAADTSEVIPSEPDLRQRAMDVLAELLESDNEEIRLRAAIELLNN